MPKSSSIVFDHPKLFNYQSCLTSAERAYQDAEQNGMATWLISFGTTLFAGTHLIKYGASNRPLKLKYFLPLQSFNLGLSHLFSSFVYSYFVGNAEVTRNERKNFCNLTKFNHEHIKSTIQNLTSFILSNFTSPSQPPLS